MLEHYLDAYIDELYKRENSFCSKEQKSLFTKDDYYKLLRPVINLISENKDDILYNMGICRCTQDEFNSIEPKFIVKYINEKYGMEVLIRDLQLFKSLYKDLTVEKPKLEEIMLLYVKGNEHESIIV